GSTAPPRVTMSPPARGQTCPEPHASRGQHRCSGNAQGEIDGMTKRVTIHVLSAAERERAERIWRQVEAASPPPPLAVSWSWTETWLRHYGDVVPHRFAVGYSHIGGEAQPRGIVLLTERIKRRGPIPLRRLFLGTAGEPAGETVYV